MMAVGQANREKVHKMTCQTFCRRNLDTLKAGMVSQGYCLLIPFGGFSYGIPVWSFNTHSVSPFTKFLVFCL